jgi:hypothetical protein
MEAPSFAPTIQSWWRCPGSRLSVRCVVLSSSAVFRIVVESPDHCAWCAGNFQSKVLFENKESEGRGETTVIQNRTHPSQQKFFDLLGTRKSHAASASFVPSFLMCYS